MASIVKAAGVHKGTRNVLSSASTDEEEEEEQGLVHVCKSTGVDAL